MRHVSLVVGLLAACTVTAASAQPINLTGTYRCIQMCRAGNFGFPTYVTQNGDAELLLRRAHDDAVDRRDIGEVAPHP